MFLNAFLIIRAISYLIFYVRILIHAASANLIVRIFIGTFKLFGTRAFMAIPKYIMKEQLKDMMLEQKNEPLHSIRENMTAYYIC